MILKVNFVINNNKIDIVNSLILLFSIVFSIVKKKYVKNLKYLNNKYLQNKIY